MFRKTKYLSLAILVLFMFSLIGCASGGDVEKKTDVILATTTSTQDSGLLDELIPVFEEQSGYKIKTIAVGTGAALAMGEKGEADVLLVHAPADEKKLVDAGIGINYQLVMHNDFVIIGPADDPAGIKGTATVAEALKKISDTGSLFVSRGDDSGTHKMEKRLWTAAGVTPEVGSTYQETGQGMGQTLTVAEQNKGYTLTDRATYLAQKKNLTLEIMVEGEKSLLNIYHVMQVNPEKFDQAIADKMNPDGAKAFVEFMIAEETQEMISQFGVDTYGQPLFYADAGKNEADLGK
ncbi:MAG: substrate-binding domain-containing protein [Syntrophomonadales bacterium]|jgi:tungstate transport system substrate-binding protein